MRGDTASLMLRFRPNFTVAGIDSTSDVAALAIGGVLLEAHANKWSKSCLGVTNVHPQTGALTDEPARALLESAAEAEPVFGCKLSGGTDLPTTVAVGHIVVGESGAATSTAQRGTDQQAQAEATEMEKGVAKAAQAQALALEQAACSSKALIVADKHST